MMQRPQIPHDAPTQASALGAEAKANPTLVIDVSPHLSKGGSPDGPGARRA
jgi:hypothetical protein